MPARKGRSDFQSLRLVRSAWRIFHGGEVTSAWIRERFGVGKATACRDMHKLLAALPVKPERVRVNRKGLEIRISVPRSVRVMDVE